MKDNIVGGAFGKPSDNGSGPKVFASPAQALHDADLQIRELKMQVKEYEIRARAGDDMLEKLKWQNAMLRVAINALGEHFKLDPPAMKLIVDPYIKEQEDGFKAMTTELKAKFVADMKAGKAPDLREFRVDKTGE